MNSRLGLLKMLNNQRENMIVCLLILIALTTATSDAQPKIEMVGVVRGDSIVIIPAVPPVRGGALNFYKKSVSGQFALLNTSGPVQPITDDDVILRMLGNKWEAFSEELSVKEPADLVFLLSEEPMAFFMIAFRYPEVIKIAGCWYTDKITDKRGEVEYRIDYLDESGAIQRSVTKSLKIRESILNPPSGVTVTPEGKNIIIEWKYPQQTRDLTDLVTQFYIYRKQGNGQAEKIYTDVIPRTNSSEYLYTDENIEYSTEYSYSLTAVDILGNESRQTEQVKTIVYDKTPPSVPEEVKADSVDGAIGVSWKMNLELDASGYNVYRSTKVDKDYTKLNTELLPLDKTFYYDKSFTYGLQYFYCITCLDKTGNESEKSNPLAILYEDVTAPEAPTDFSYSLENNVLKFSWVASKSPDVEGYYFYRGESIDILPRITATAINVLAYTDSGYAGGGFTPGQRYTFAVSAVDKGRNESKKVIIADILIPDNTPPEPPQGLMTENVNGNYVLISSGGSISADVAIYKLFRSEVPSAPVELTTFTSTPLRYTDSTVKKGSTYIYFTLAVDSAGNTSVSGKKDTVEVKDNTPPPSPRMVKAKKLQAGNEITWEMVYDFDLLGYNVYKSSLPNGNYLKVNNDVVKELRFIDSGGRDNEFYRVRAIDSSGNESTKGEYASPK
ncbi:MAG: hypothetical protein HUU54_07925 [Ignavibacteriaceae bacterium]|nr:hypothetical protein [Ignavibacteriaceae bacterium]